jgi:hypothetical protein
MAPLRILSPHDGDVLNRHDGTETAEELLVTVSGTAPEGAAVSVNGVAATVEGGEFRAQVPLRQRRTRLVADGGDGDDGRASAGSGAFR